MDKTIMIVDLYKSDKDKTRIFSSIYEFWYEIIRLDLDDDLKSRYLKYINECLKMNVFYFNNKSNIYVDYRVFLRRFVMILGVNPISKIEPINKLLAEYGKLFNDITWHYPYVDKVGSLDVDFDVKASYLMTIYDYLRDLFASLSYYQISDEVKNIIMYSIDGIFDGDYGNVRSSLSDRVFTILKELYLDDKFSLSNGGFETFLSGLSEEEMRVWSKYHISLIACSDNTKLIFDEENDQEVFKSVSKKLIDYSLDKQQIM